MIEIVREKLLYFCYFIYDIVIYVENVIKKN